MAEKAKKGFIKAAARTLPVLGLFIVSQIVLSLMGFLYHEHLWTWPIFMDMTDKYGVSVPQILLFDVTGFIVPGVIAAALLNRSREEMRLGLPRNGIIWLIALIGAATAFIAGGGIPKADGILTVMGMNLLLYHIIIAVSEEGFFRGLVQAQSEKALGRVWGTLLQILLYVVTPIVLLRLVNEADARTIIAQVTFFYLPVGVLSTILTRVTSTILPSVLIRIALAVAWNLM